MAGKTVLVYPEQGFGDAIQFIRYVPLVHARGARVVVACHQKLARLCQTVEGVATVLTPEQPLPPIDYCTPLMSLPLAMKTRLETIPAQVPYVSAEPGDIAAWQRRIAGDDGRLQVGVAWQGNPKFPASRAKACPLERLAPLFAVPGCAFFSLQAGEAAAALRAWISQGQPVTDVAGGLESFSDTAAVVCALDLVITIDTAVAHLAGALGKPVWILLPSGGKGQRGCGSHGADPVQEIGRPCRDGAGTLRGEAGGLPCRSPWERPTGVAGGRTWGREFTFAAQKGGSLVQ